MIARRTFFGTIGSMFIPKLVSSDNTQEKGRVNNLTLSIPDIDQVNVEKYYMEKYECWRLEMTTKLKNGSLWAIHIDLNDKTINEGYRILMRLVRKKVRLDHRTEFRYSKNLRSFSIIWE